MYLNSLLNFVALHPVLPALQNHLQDVFSIPAHLVQFNDIYYPFRMCADCHLPGTLCMWTDCTTCFESCASTAGECDCLGGAGEAGLPLLFIMGLIVLGLFTIIGIFYNVLVATMVGQRIWQRHYHILAKQMLTKVSFLYSPFHMVCLLLGFTSGLSMCARLVFDLKGLVSCMNWVVI